MHIKDAVVQRFQALCAVRNIRYNELAVRSGVTPSTVYSMMDPKRKDLSILTIKNSATDSTSQSQSFSTTKFFKPGAGNCVTP